MQVPEFIRFRCANSNGHSACSTCARDFVVPVKAIEAIFKDRDGTAMIGIGGTHFLVNPECPINGNWEGLTSRYIHTTLPFETLVLELDGLVRDLGDVTLQNV